jgi:hypothetical protein
MECVDFRSKYIIVGDLRLDVECASDGTPESVSVSEFDATAEPRAVFNDVSCELVERVAAALVHIRSQVRDERRACADHGYYDGEKCPECSYVGVPG